MNPHSADHPSTHWIRTAIVTIVVAAVTTLFLSTCVRPWLARETALAPAPVTSSATVAPTQTARVLVQVVTAMPALASLPAGCPLPAALQAHAVYCAGADDFDGCLGDMVRLDQLATQTSLQATEQALPIVVPCPPDPDELSPVRVRVLTTARAHPDPSASNLGQVVPGVVRRLRKSTVDGDGTLWYAFQTLPTSDYPNGAPGLAWLKAQYAECLWPTPVAP